MTPWAWRCEDVELDRVPAAGALEPASCHVGVCTHSSRGVWLLVCEILPALSPADVHLPVFFSNYFFPFLKSAALYTTFDEVSELERTRCLEMKRCILLNPKRTIRRHSHAHSQENARGRVSRDSLRAEHRFQDNPVGPSVTRQAANAAATRPESAGPASRLRLLGAAHRLRLALAHFVCETPQPCREHAVVTGACELRGWGVWRRKVGSESHRERLSLVECKGFCVAPGGTLTDPNVCDPTAAPRGQERPGVGGEAYSPSAFG